MKSKKVDKIKNTLERTLYNTTYLKINIHENDYHAKSSSYNSSNNAKYHIRQEISFWMCFNWNLLKGLKTYKKYKSIISFHNEKKEYDKLSDALNSLPLKIQRQQKLDAIKNKKNG